MTEQITNENPALSGKTQEINESSGKYGKSIFKKWIYAKFDAKLILEIIEKDIYFNPRLSILLPTLNPNGKKTFLSATMDLKGLKNLHSELTNAIQILEENSTSIQKS